ncbi:MAG: large-conductance mechanosensitive channel protein MscL [Porphyromonas sp.]|jgi:large conductance mechanosensitive channel protein|nr:large-conductance mechanosensitive channel protein MscL [Porphyromonas sp.]
MGFIKEFQEFAVKGNVMDMAVGVIIGGAFGKIVASLVNDVIMPPLGLITGNGFTDLKLVLKPATAAVTDASGNVVTPEVAEVALNYGNFIQNTVDFIIIAFVIFLLIKGMNSLRKKEEPAPTAPAEDPADIALLKEIRDELKKRN